MSERDRTAVVGRAGDGLLWRLVATLAAVHVVLMFGSFALQRIAPLDAAPSVVIADHADWSMTRGFAGGYLTFASFLVFLLAATLLARLLRGRDEFSGWWSSTVAATAAVYVAVSVCGELAPLGVALYAGHHGATSDALAMLVGLHWFAVYLATGVLGLFTVAVAAASRTSGVLPRWVGYSGFAVGALAIVSVPAAGAGLSDAATAVWALWFLALGTAAWRWARTCAERPEQPSAVVAA